MIARIWVGRTKASDADEYLSYLEETGLREYRATAGNRGVFVLRRIEEERAEFMLVSLWGSMDAVRAFAGPNPERAVYYPEDDRFHLEKTPNVLHYEVLVER